MEGWRLLRCAALFGALGAGVLFSAQIFRISTAQPFFGFTFSSVYARSLGLEPHEVLVAAVEDFRPAFVRIPVYWSDVAPAPDVFLWEETDRALAFLGEADVDVHMVVGAKVPRWPECFIPEWVAVHDREEYERSLMDFMRAALVRYRDYVAVWQVENEPFFPFGDCPALSLDTLAREVALVRELDPSAQVQLTVSGEQQLWESVAPLADRIGVSVYRTARSPWLGTVSFPVPSLWYFFMRLPLERTHEVVISELQLEPWFVSHPRYIDLVLAAAYFSPEQAKNHFAYARATGFSEVSLWGVEWWYYLREHGYGELWEVVRGEVKSLK